MLLVEEGFPTRRPQGETILNLQRRYPIGVEMQPNGASPKESGSGASGPFSEEVTPENDLRALISVGSFINLANLSMI